MTDKIEVTQHDLTQAFEKIGLGEAHAKLVFDEIKAGTHQDQAEEAHEVRDQSHPAHPAPHDEAAKAKDNSKRL